IERTVEDGGGQSSPVARLLAAEPDREELVVAQDEECARGERIRGEEQPIEGGLRRRERDLLLEDDVDEGREPRCPVPQRGDAPTRDDRREIRIGGRQGRGRAGEGRRV